MIVDNRSHALWHGLLPLPLVMIARSPEIREGVNGFAETDGRRQWHGQETVPQQQSGDRPTTEWHSARPSVRGDFHAAIVRAQLRAEQHQGGDAADHLRDVAHFVYR